MYNPHEINNPQLIKKMRCVQNIPVSGLMTSSSVDKRFWYRTSACCGTAVSTYSTSSRKLLLSGRRCLVTCGVLMRRRMRYKEWKRLAPRHVLEHLQVGPSRIAAVQCQSIACCCNSCCCYCCVILHPDSSCRVTEAPNTSTQVY